MAVSQENSALLSSSITRVSFNFPFSGLAEIKINWLLITPLLD